MIHALINIGKALRDIYSEELALIEVPYSRINPKNSPKVMVINLQEENKILKCLKITLSEYDPDKKIKYFFRDSSSAQGTSPSLSFKFPPKFRALEQRLKILELLGYSVNISELAKLIKNKVEEFKKEGLIKGQTPLLVVLQINGMWPGENQIFLQKFKTLFFENLGQKSFIKYWKRKAICHGCKEIKIVYGGVGDLLKFYTVDKYGYAPEINPKDAWKQYALCEDCILDLERGKRAVEEFLTYDFYGKTFWILPVAEENLLQVLNKFLRFKKQGGEVYKERFEKFEDRLLYEASQVKEPYLFYHFVFLTEERRALRILLHLKEVLPSLLSKYIKTKQKVESFFKNFLGVSLFFNFFSSPSFKSTSEVPGFNEEDFFKLLNAVFTKKNIEEKFLLSKIMSKIRSTFIKIEKDFPNNSLIKFITIEAFLHLYFLFLWKILKRKSEEIPINFRRDSMVNTKENLKFEKFFKNFEDFFDHPAKKGLLLLGVLLQEFLTYQYKERGSTPFVKKLKGLHLNQKDVQNLFKELVNKMYEYNIGHYWKDLREGISLYFLEGGRDWKLSPEEIGFYLVLGMSLSSKLTFISKQES